MTGMNDTNDTNDIIDMNGTIRRRASIRPLLAVIGSVLSFALLIESAGLIPAVIVSVLVASRGARETRFRQALVFGACLALAMWILFVMVLGQPFPLIRGW
jgi:hypothetical protein